MKKKSVALLISIASIPVISFVTSLSQAEAATSTTRVIIAPGPLSIQSIADVNFGEITLNGQTQNRSETRDLKFVDFRGRVSEGWRINVRRNNGIDNRGVSLKLQGTDINHEKGRVTLSEAFEVTTEAKTLAQLTGAVNQPNEFTIPVKHDLEILASAVSGDAQTILTWDLRAEP